MLSLVRMVFRTAVTCQNGFLANMELNRIGRKVRVGILSLKKYKVARESGFFIS